MILAKVYQDAEIIDEAINRGENNSIVVWDFIKIHIQNNRGYNNDNSHNSTNYNSLL